MRLADELHIGGKFPGSRGSLTAFLPISRRPSSSCLAKSAWTTQCRPRIERAVDCVRTKSCRRSATTQPSALVMPGRAGTSTLRNAEFAGEGRGMERTCAAKGEEREVARVLADRLIDTIRICPRHVGIGDADQHRIGRSLASRPSRAPSSLWKIVLISASGHASPGMELSRSGTGGQAAGWHPKSSAACRPGHSRSGREATGALRPDLQNARRIDTRDRAAAGADGADIDHRHMDRHGIFDSRSRSRPAARRRGSLRTSVEVPPMS
jgi:hypothetical protein